MFQFQKTLAFLFYYIYLLSAQYLKLQDCQAQGQFYSSQLPQCGQCSQDCFNCFDDQRCIYCQQMYYQESLGSSCVNSCQEGQYADHYFRECKNCLVSNCLVCNEEQVCLKCKQGWILSDDGSSCKNTKCKNNEETYYDQETDTCKLYCSEGQDQNSMQCFKFRKINGVTEEVLRLNNSNNLDIYQIGILQIERQATVIALDLEKAVYYSYPDLIPYFEISFNQTAYFTFLKGDYIFVIFSDQNNFSRINIQTTRIDYYQLEQCVNPVVEQNYLICIQNNLNDFNILDLDSKPFNLFKLQSQSRVLQQQKFDAKQNIRFGDLQQKIMKNQKAEEKISLLNEQQYEKRYLQNQPQNTDNFGCFIKSPQQFDYQPKLIVNILKQSKIYQFEQKKSQVDNDNQQTNVYLLSNINLLLVYQQITSLLYSFDTQNFNNYNVLIQFQNISQVACASSFNNDIQLFLINKIDSSIGYYLSSTQDSGNYQFNQTKATQFQQPNLGNLQYCKFVNQSKAIFIQGNNDRLIAAFSLKQRIF
ncbi:hypothetical protein TTHERM_00701030 (macronuclear) [Tetrahymena thermophila SB210]|uniref:Transmembrane protein n=1 Tax=Tetrahymena thermophila (strain SB210) TaxID=312017 RepID=Q22LP6_TETTS|nr:hypothetical protein TTHERM_00701030 [Tetrahymena thermophila SB210]EAR86220.1 hypothetical protein TTHERM_00701030 [Tetrahymena thermophila SB210]|eukprot:XP_976815.1 hypothetical protein TTHERM_00701030 [Tetrahymena thermophila SB210]